MIAKPFTGRHMAVVLCGFFAVVIAVNMLMATLATRTFGGVVVENSYVASQAFNGWLAKARQQERLGWSINPSLAADRRVTLAVSVANAAASGVASHPLGRLPDVAIRFHRSGELLVSDKPLPEGRWHVRLTVRRGSDEVQLVETLS